MKKTEVESVEISNRVFYRNSYVKSVDLANVPFVNNDMSYAFNRCYNLMEVKNINPNTVNMIYSFNGCYNLVSIPEIPTNATNIAFAFAYCNKMTGEVNIPGGVTSMYNAFYNCTNITSVKNLSSGDLRYTFAYCSNLTSVCDIPEGATSLYSTFANCSRLKTAPNLPSTLTLMVDTFNGCSNLSQVPDIPNNVTNMQNTFQNCIRLIDAPNISSSVQQLESTFANCYSLVNAPVIPNTVVYMNRTFANCRMLRNAPVIPNSVTNMCGTFFNCYNLTNVGSLSTNVQDIISCFYECQNLVNAPDIPDSARNISYAFYNCVNLVNAPNIGNSVWNMSHTFQRCTNLTNVSNIPNSVMDMSDAFNCCYHLCNAPVLGNSVTNIANAFNGCSRLTSTPTFPNTMVNMANAFYGCYSLTTAANIPDNVTNLHETFYLCENLVSAPRLPNNDSIDTLSMTFYGCKKITDAPVIPNSVISITGAFSGCSSLVNVPVIPESVTNCQYAFANCSSLTGDVRFLSKEITNVTNLFANTTLTKNVYIPYTYENRVNTTTYNTFIAAGYDENGTLEGVHLMDSSENCAITFSLTNKVDGAQVIAIIDNDQLPDTTQPWKVKAGEHKYSIATDKNGLVEGTFTISDADIAAKVKTIIVELPTNGLTVALSGTANDEAIDKSNFVVTYPVSQSSLTVEFSNVDSIVVNSGTALTFSIDAMINNKIYSANETRTITENTSIALVATLVGEHVVYTYPFNQTYSYANLTNLVDSTKFAVDETLQALTSKAAYNVDNGTAYGYIEFTTPATSCTVSVTGGVSSESNYDFGAVYIGKAVYTPTQNQIKQGTTDGNGQYMFKGSGDVTSATYTKELEPNTTYFLSFAYAKDSSQNGRKDCLFITNITFNAVSPAPVKYIDINPDVSTTNAADGSGRTVLTRYNGTDTTLTFGTISEE